MQSAPSPVILPKETLVRMVENAVGSRLFNSLFVRYEPDGKPRDVCADGEFSCAYFVSGLLTLTGYLEKPHATVASLRSMLIEKGFAEAPLDEVRPGDIVFWEKMRFDSGSEHEHVGFALDGETAVSMSDKLRAVARHDIRMSNEEGDRAITLVLRLP